MGVRPGTDAQDGVCQDHLYFDSGTHRVPGPNLRALYGRGPGVSGLRDEGTGRCASDEGTGRCAWYEAPAALCKLRTRARSARLYETYSDPGSFSGTPRVPGPAVRALYRRGFGVSGRRDEGSGRCAWDQEPAAL